MTTDPSAASSEARPETPARHTQRQRERMPLSRWLPVAGAFAVGAIVFGTLYTFPALSIAIAEELHVSRTVVVTPWTILLLISALTSPFLGRAYDLFPDRWLLSIGMVLLAAGWALAAVSPDMGLLIVAFGILLAVGTQLVFVGISTAISRRYAGMTGLALGIAYAGFGIGIAIGMPAATFGIELSSWRDVTLAFAVASIVGLPFVWLMTSGPAVLVPALQQKGSKSPTSTAADGADGADAEPSRWLPADPAAPGAIAAAGETEPPEAAGPREAEGVRRILKTRRFWILFIGAVAIAFFDDGLYQAFIPHVASRGVSIELASLALGIQSLAFVAGQVVGGGLSDRIGRRSVGVTAVAIALVGCVGSFLATGELAWLAVAGMIVQGVGLGATIAIRSSTFSDVFGGRDFGAIFGVLAVAYPLGGAISTYAGGLSHDLLGTYMPMVGVFLFGGVVWGSALWIAGPRRHGRGPILSRRMRRRLRRARMATSRG